MHAVSDYDYTATCSGQGKFTRLRNLRVPTGMQETGQFTCPVCAGQHTEFSCSGLQQPEHAGRKAANERTAWAGDPPAMHFITCLIRGNRKYLIKVCYYFGNMSLQVENVSKYVRP